MLLKEEIYITAYHVQNVNILDIHNEELTIINIIRKLSFQRHKRQSKTSQKISLKLKDEAAIHFQGLFEFLPN